MLTKKQIGEDLKACINNRWNNTLILIFGSIIGIIQITIINDENSTVPLVLIMLLCITITFACWHGNSLIMQWHLEYMPWEEQPLRKTLYLVLLNGVYTSLVIVGALIIFYSIVDSVSSEKLITSSQWGVGFGMIVSLFMNTLYSGVYFFERWKESLVEAERLKRENIQSELASLRNQVNPHFLFNSLNTLTSLIVEDQEKAVGFVRDFSDLYRYILKSEKKEVSTLADELKATNIYLQIQQERFQDKLLLNIDISMEKMDSYIPTLTLQMLTENCIKHNIVSRKKPLTINIFVEKNHLIVRNNLQNKITVVESTGLGLQNIIKRYHHLSNQKVEIEENEGHFQVKIPLLNIS